MRSEERFSERRKVTEEPAVGERGEGDAQVMQIVGTRVRSAGMRWTEWMRTRFRDGEECING